ncbi:monovalent cation:proton antiporter-2 (CPA2) family protein [Pseudofulvimonas gallinarii]|jgi:glutathione-regulated potassium-efflux system protein KefB|uniref:Kef-type potassium/proton antiporter (CPA2 family) n=1 Tax=Pseudofulvimonas gallinarii TaxID=634155 RepID=A0A4V6RRE6_9GAMM|nr:monovalent cation:proton antiporter-2 (CPA2) family protein [Pseudofulvimonas gallinarii]TCT01389.1 Kef-type potassium/proton antiporter (CPA2 family) [Pseudofulvimonas gallinarii]THD15141.1 potassium transporter [Pseudofulvimonas gallinarii]
MSAESHAFDLLPVVSLLGAGVIAVAVFRRLGLGSVLGYFAAGLLIGPYGFGLFTDPQSILHVAELGVVMFLFVIGLEMQPSRLWNLRTQIFGLGLAQVGSCGAILTAAGVLAGLPWMVAFIAAMGFVLSSTASVMQLLDERGETASTRGQKAVSILLLEDLAIVPLLALVAILAPATGEAHGSSLLAIAIGLGAIAVVLVTGRYLLNPLFRILAASGAREVMTAAALLVVLGTALLMQMSGLSMAMGAFLAGVLLSESSFRHQLEADIEPFRGLLLGLFFLSVGMALDLSVVASDWRAIAIAVAGYMALKAAGIYVVARLFRDSHGTGLHRATLMAQGGEFAFVLYSAAAAVGLIDGKDNAFFSAVVILSMSLTPLALIALRYILPSSTPSLDGVDVADDLHGTVLIIGFGRFGQVASQSLLARGIDITIIDSDVEMIRSAAEFGFKVYYGDGTRLDVLHASGAPHARAILVCVDDPKTADRIVELVRGECPLTRLLVRAYDREHALRLAAAGVNHFIRETFESALRFGEMALRVLDVPEDEAAAVAADIRRRDSERFELESTGGFGAGRDLLLGNAPRPTPLTTPTRTAKPLSPETAAVTAGDGAGERSH